MVILDVHHSFLTGKTRVISKDENLVVPDKDLYLYNALEIGSTLTKEDILTLKKGIWNA
ncbi:MAG: hypothetical protein LBV22_02080 [Mycoplasmataceae bacterium]|nr:hypothetical protein [Mycoplasmataceae bacterium]